MKKIVHIYFCTQEKDGGTMDIDEKGAVILGWTAPENMRNAAERLKKDECEEGKFPLCMQSNTYLLLQVSLPGRQIGV